MMFINKSKIHFESKSQHHGGFCGKPYGCLSISQRYILKANHNDACKISSHLAMFINKSKIHFESKSQQKIKF
ncbi:MAG: hypothetical protein JWP12_968 [Bacteroidetes bacterium]|nr:hypothetical protein [Bacteroidota bacterium]